MSTAAGAATQERVVTPEQIEGPYWLPGSPERASLANPGVKGVPMTLSGRVLFRDGEAAPDVWLDFWQCDGEGVYDIGGYTLRGHQFTDAEGRYRLETVVPVEYIDVIRFRGRESQVHRTSHVHAKIKVPTRQTLTTQLYFPGEPHNEKDRLFRPECLMDVRRDGERVVASFDFILPW